MTLERTAFESSRAGEYFDSRQLSTLTGVAPKQFASVILKESIDNGLDACEMAGVSVDRDGLMNWRRGRSIVCQADLSTS